MQTIVTQKDIEKIKRRFDDIDFERTGEIDYDEFLEDIGEPRSPFVDAVFSLVDINGNGLLDFSEYVRIFCVGISMWAWWPASKWLWFQGTVITQQ